MRDLKKFNQEYFKKFRPTPLKLVPFSPIQKEIAEKWVKKIKNVLREISVKVSHRGSTLFEISGKGDIDVAVYAGDRRSFSLAGAALVSVLGKAKASDKNFAAFYAEDGGYEVEISLMKGYEAEADQALTKAFLVNPLLVKKYQEIKNRYCYSKREYLIQRSRFFTQILKSL